jgi:hypothetical protein
MVTDLTAADPDRELHGAAGMVRASVIGLN